MMLDVIGIDGPITVELKISKDSIESNYWFAGDCLRNARIRTVSEWMLIVYYYVDSEDAIYFSRCLTVLQEAVEKVA